MEAGAGVVDVAPVRVGVVDDVLTNIPARRKHPPDQSPRQSRCPDLCLKVAGHDVEGCGRGGVVLKDGTARHDGGVVGAGERHLVPGTAAGCTVVVDVEAVGGASAASETRGVEPAAAAAAAVGKNGSGSGQVAVEDVVAAVGDGKSMLGDGVRDAHLSGVEPVEILALAKRLPRAQPTMVAGCGGVFLRNLLHHHRHGWGRGAMQENHFCPQRIRRTRHLEALN